MGRTMLYRDFAYAWRTLAKSPGFTIAAVLTLALGIGLNSTIFSIVDAVLLRRLPYKDAERLVSLWERNTKLGYEQNPPAAGNISDWRNQNRSFESISIYLPDQHFGLNSGDRPERLPGAAVSYDLFETLRVSPQFGRVFTRDDEQPGRNRSVVLSDALWQRRFNSRRDIIGQSIELNAQSYTVIGVMPPGFDFPGNTGTVLDTFTIPAAQLWVPLSLTAQQWQARSSHDLFAIARLKPGVTLDRAGAEMNAIEARIVAQHPKDFVGSDVNIVPLYSQVVGGVRPTLLVLFIAVAFVLLIGCANVANLFVARGSSRHREIAIRACLGADRRRIVVQLLVECVLLAFGGCIVALLVANWSLDALKSMLPANVPRSHEIALDWRVAAFAFALSLVTTVAFGLMPALHLSSTDLTVSLRERTAGGSPGRRNLRRFLVVSETAFAVVLLTGAGLMIHSLLLMQDVSPGFRSDHVLAAELSLPAAKYNRTQRAAFFDELLRRVSAVGGVEAAGITTNLPLSGNNMAYAFTVIGRPQKPGEFPGSDCRAVSADYFRAMRIPLVKGRLFSNADTATSKPVVLVNRTLVKHLFPNEDPLGKSVKLGFNNFTAEIVGIVGDVQHTAIGAEVQNETYSLYSQTPFWPDLTLTVRTAGDPSQFAPALQAAVRSLDDTQPLSAVQPMEAVVAKSVSQPRFRTLLLFAFGVLALSLAAVGIYGVTAYTTAQRSNEIGIRMALGAERRDVVRAVVGQALVLSLTGIAIGLAGSAILTRFMQAMLFHVQPLDPVTFAAVAVVLTLVTVAASYLPAYRASRVDPLTALRYE